MTLPSEGDGKTAFLFPGHGSPYVNMGYQCYQSVPLFREVIQRANPILEKRLGASFEELVFLTDPGVVQATNSDSLYSVESKIQTLSENLVQTQIVQPLILIIDFVYYQMLHDAGVRADVMAGHSVGEFAAAVAGGMLEFEEAIELMFERGRIYYELQKKGVDTGKMAAIFASSTAVQNWLEENAVKGVFIASINAPSQAVISGVSHEVTDVLARMRKLGWRGQVLPVNVGWHCSAVAQMGQEAWAEALSRVQYRESAIPILNNVDFKFYPSSADNEDSEETLAMMVASRWLRQLHEPMDFVRCIEVLYQNGVRTFVEVGPKKILTSLLGGILADRPFRSFALDPTPNAGPGALEKIVEALGQEAPVLLHKG